MATFANHVRDSLVEVDNAGRFVRTAAGFRNIISPSNSDYPPEFGRYHLYVSLACPWANRCVAVRNMKGLQDCIGLTIVHPTWQRTKPENPDDNHLGWIFAEPNQALIPPSGYGSITVKQTTADPINGLKTIRDIYELSQDTLKKYSVPVLFDKKTNRIVNNESSEIIRMFTSVFDEWATGPLASSDFYPEPLRAEIDAVNDWVYPNINDGVYKCGFAKSQIAYNEAIDVLFNSLDRMEALLSNQRYLVGNAFTEADIRAFMTLVRFDEVYIVYFKCNVKAIRDYPNILNYCRDIYQKPGMKESIDMDHIKTHYFTSHQQLNCYSIIPKGPNFLKTLEEPHNRNQF